MGSGTARSVLLVIACLLSIAATGQTSETQAGIYSIDGQRSILRVYVGRAGILSRMGHNHVIHTRNLSGQIMLAENPVDSSASFSFAVQSLVVDEPTERQRAGDGFESQPNDSAISGTRENMLGVDVLDSEAFPLITAAITTVSSEQEQWQFDVRLQFQDSSIDLRIPARLSIDDDVLSVQTQFSLSHEQLGLSPFTAIGGALRVAEDLDFELSIEAVAAP